MPNTEMTAASPLRRTKELSESRYSGAVHTLCSVPAGGYFLRVSENVSDISQNIYNFITFTILFSLLENSPFKLLGLVEQIE